MKTTLAILIAGLFLMTTPLSALADGGWQRNQGTEHGYGWTKDRHAQRDHRSPAHRIEHKRQQLAKKHYNNHRHEYRCAHRLHHRYDRRVYASAPLIVAPPRVVFRIGW